MVTKSKEIKEFVNFILENEKDFLIEFSFDLEKEIEENMVTFSKDHYTQFYFFNGIEIYYVRKNGKKIIVPKDLLKRVKESKNGLGKTLRKRYVFNCSYYPFQIIETAPLSHEDKKKFESKSMKHGLVELLPSFLTNYVFSNLREKVGAEYNPKVPSEAYSIKRKPKRYQRTSDYEYSVSFLGDNVYEDRKAEPIDLERLYDPKIWRERLLPLIE